MGQSSVKPEGYLPHIVDEQVERYLRIVIEHVIASLARNLGQAATYGTIREDALGSTGFDGVRRAST